ncbi:MAG TPA: hypothetical protein VEZ47_08250 [Gemmatirosa sp.]|nr:hypothetical protein [Gemmatirosa sp.]
MLLAVLTTACDQPVAPRGDLPRTGVTAPTDPPPASAALGASGVTVRVLGAARTAGAVLRFAPDGRLADAPYLGARGLRADAAPRLTPELVRAAAARLAHGGAGDRWRVAHLADGTVRLSYHVRGAEWVRLEAPPVAPVRTQYAASVAGPTLGSSFGADVATHADPAADELLAQTYGQQQGVNADLAHTAQVAAECGFQPVVPVTDGAFVPLAGSAPSSGEEVRSTSEEEDPCSIERQQAAIGVGMWAAATVGTIGLVQIGALPQAYAMFVVATERYVSALDRLKDYRTCMRNHASGGAPSPGGPTAPCGAYSSGQVGCVSNPNVAPPGAAL